MINDTRESTGYSAPLVYKVFAILQEIAGSDSDLGISDLSRRLNISKSTVYGITQALTDLGVVLQEPGTKKFRLGPTLIKLGSRALAGIDIRTVARPIMEELSDRFRETIFLGTFDDKGITIIEKSESPAELKISAPVGTRIPIFAGAAGKVFLSGLDDQSVKSILSQKTIPCFTENTVTNTEKYFEELLVVRRKGYATDLEEYIRGVNAICVPVLDQLGKHLAAMWMVGFVHSFSGEKMSQAIESTMEAAAGLSRMLGGQGLG
ncbi:MAG: IclR family transcriptional regulator [Bacillota bacterium]